MELLFTQATVVVELFGAGYVASSFALYAQRRLNQSSRGRSHRSDSIQELSSENPPPQPPKRKPTPTEQLRQQCQKAGIKWRNAHGKNKHLKKAEMIAALQQLQHENLKCESPIVAPSHATKSTVHCRHAA
ncbi:hypothetical protein [Thermocoleostomius sinensis]|uniref:Uncharacterized protein n=1 Tax=Thermocoleostomius sinensis A174 TaxID=2016057 RepID=A0A9E8ZD36_9CYAN|nr:hypothetical protein [Thermocoleostomius sinensis]WAL59637.1 hypothetical protein OXH18_21075 [Thermocoleostomius sinensis A174]